MRRGFIFTLDVLLAFILVSTIVVGVVTTQINTQSLYQTYMREQSMKSAGDVLTILRTVPLNQLVPGDVIKEWIQNGTLNTTLVSPDMSPLDILATYWAIQPLYPSVDYKGRAKTVINYVLQRLLPGYGYEFVVSNESFIRTSNPQAAEDISTSSMVLSGYSYNRTPRGYVARAYLTRATVIREDLYGWFRVLAGADDGYNVLNITRVIHLPSDAQILEADGKFVTRMGERVTLYINGRRVSMRYGQININDLTGYLRGGDNIVSLVFDDGSYEIGSASGTTMYVKYESNSLEVEDPGLVKVYNVISERTGIMYLLEMFVPGNITSINMKFKVRNVNVVRLYYGFGGNLYLLLEKYANPNGDAIVEFTDDEIKTKVNEVLCGGNDCYEEFKKNISKMVFDFVIGFDAYYNDNTGYWEYEGDTYNDRANRERIIYGYPDSYVKIEYIPRTVRTMYSIPISIYFPYDDSRVSYPGQGLRVEYYLPPTVEPWYADWWVGYTFTDYSTIQNLYENNRRFYSGPLGRYAIRVAYTRLYDWMMQPGQNNVFEIKMTNGNSYVRDEETRGIIKYFIQGYAGYGDVFPYLLQGYPTYKGYNLTYYYYNGRTTEERTILVGDSPYKVISVEDLDPTKYAVDDAVLRLFNQLNYLNDLNPGDWKVPPYDGSQQNPIDVDLPAGVTIQMASMGNIPGLFTPITVTLRIWRES
ncbi:TPM domain-containing protein [Pyrococcus kukulkanii]|uniref:TPM domain-containing protein n=1 Tax=Pyrococcus kukulkanii TaxID=1609559 RepID=A0ABV4T0M1_9EURY